MRCRTLTLGALVLSLWGPACRQQPLPAVEPVPLGTWRVSLESPGGELPFFLRLDRTDSEVTATILNGEERVTTSDVSLDGQTLTIDFRVFNSRIRADIQDAQLVGSLTVTRSGGTRQTMALRATRGQAHRFSHESEAPAVDISGRWAVTFHPNDSTETPAIGEFEQDGYSVTGTFLTPTGDYRFLAGDVTDRRVRLSTFDGYYAFLFDAEVDSADVMRGDFWSGTHSHESWVAVRDENASLPDADALTFVKPGGRDFTFSLPDTTGRLVTFRDPLFLGKVVVASISGTWCPNCHDEAAFWAPYYRANRDRGLEIVGIMFEHEENLDEAVEQVKAFAARHAIDYPLLVGGSSDKQEAHRILPMLNHVMAYPTTLFIDRRGVVRRIHTGFSGPGTGRHYRELTREFADYVDFLLAEDPA